MNSKNIIYVSAAFFPVNRKLLVVQRPENKKDPLKWEMPGGKVKENESFENSIIREIKEELDIDIEIASEIGSAEVQLADDILIFEFIRINGKSEDIKLKEHKDIKYVTLEELENLDLCEADRSFIKNYKEEIKKFID